MKALIFFIHSMLLLTNGVVSSSVSMFELGEVNLFAKPASYDVESTLFLNDVFSQVKEVSYKIKAQLTIQPLWKNADSEFFLKLQLVKPQLYLRGKHPNANFMPHQSVWDSHTDSPFYVHWKNGLIVNSYLDPKELPDFINYKKSLISLFQLQIIDGEHNETDISGTCNILYESISKDVFRKIKRSCSSDSPLAGSGTARRLARYTLGAGGRLAGAHAEEQLELGAPAAALKARSWHRLQAAAPAPAPAPPASSLDAALATLPAALTPQDLALVDTGTIGDESSLPAALGAHRGALAGEAAGEGGGVPHARAALVLLPLLRAANAKQLKALLEDKDNYPILTGLCRLLGLAGTPAAHTAVDSFVHLGARDPLAPLAREYLAGAALAPKPRAKLLDRLMALADDAKDESVSSGAVIAAGATGARLPPPAADRTRDWLAKGLARCKDDACRCIRLRALGALRRADAAELLLEHAERGSRAPALEALEALRQLLHEHNALHYARRLRLEKIATRPGRPLEVRAAALDLLILSSSFRPVPLAGVGVGLLRGPVELQRLFWERLLQLADEPHGKEIRDVLPMMPRELKTWNARALGGTSSVLVRPTGWNASGWSALLESVQVASDGLLRSGTVRLHAIPDKGAEGGGELLGVQVWTRGLAALAGSSSNPDPNLYEGDEEDEEVSGGLSLAVGGVWFPPIQLFSGQGELLAHVWGGAASEPTPALRAVTALPPVDVMMPLLVGAPLRFRAGGAVALALDASVQISLWSRSARALVEVRLGATVESRADVSVPWTRLRATHVATAAPKLRIHADLDFYTTTALCVRLHTDDYQHDRESELESVGGARRLVVRRRRNSSQPTAGRTLHLGARNAAACNAVPAAD